MPPPVGRTNGTSHGASAAKPSAAAAATTLSSFSPNHPHNLRKLATVDLTEEYTVKSYVGAANALRDKAQAADLQGQLENAFVNYLKAAQIVLFIPKHREWEGHVLKKNTLYYRYQDLTQKTPEMLNRAKRIEEQLIEREESRMKELQAEQATAAASSAPRITMDSVTDMEGGGTDEVSGQLDANIEDALNTWGGAQPSGARAHPTTADRQPQQKPGNDSSESYGSDSDSQHAADSSRSRAEEITAQLHGKSAIRSRSGTPDLSVDVGDDEVESEADNSLEARLKALRGPSAGAAAQSRLADTPTTPTPRTGRDGCAIDLEIPNDVQHHYEADDPYTGAKSDKTPTGSGFSDQYPTLDDFERGLNGHAGAAANGPSFPSIPGHTPGKGSRTSALGEPPSRPFFPPAPPTELMGYGNGSRPTDYAIPPPSGASEAAAKRPRPPISTGLQSDAHAASPPSAAPPKLPSPAPTPPSLPGAGDGTFGQMPTFPATPYVKATELWHLLNPGFAKVRDSNGMERIEKRKGPKVLLLDVRSRADFDQGRIKAQHCVCIEPLMLKPGITSEEIEDKIIISPSQEQRDFAQRGEFDLVVLYNQNSRNLGPAQVTASASSLYGGAGLSLALEAQEKMDTLFKALAERGFGKSLKRQPILLVGGFDSWYKTLGDDPVMQSTHTARDPRQVLQQRPGDDEKRSRRQGGVFPDEIDTPHTIPPAYQFDPAARSGITRPPMAAAGGAAGYGAPPAMPSRTYAGGMSGSGSGEDLIQPSRIFHTAYPSPASQPHIPYGKPQAARQPSFDYPQLRRGQSPNPGPTPPPMAAGGGARAGHHRSETATSIRDVARVQEPLHRPPLAIKHSNSPFAASSIDRIRIGTTGLKNVGNTCYMNSTLQCLSATPRFARFFLDGSYKKAINATNPLGTKGVLAEAFAQLVRVLWSEQYTFVSPVTFRQAITRFAPAFRGYDQHDSQEFLAFLLDGLHEDLNYVVHKPPPVEMTPGREEELETLPQQIASVKEWSIYRQRNDSLIVDFFQGQFRNKMTCLTCGKTSTTYNAFMYLSLPVPSGRGISKVTLEQCLDAFVREEIMDKADAWNCPRCKKPRKATKRLSISRLPHFLLIHLKRFSFRGPVTDKIETRVTFPLSSLDLTNYMPPPLPPGAMMKDVPVTVSQQPPYIYDLFAVTHHFGTLNAGHYTATIRNNGQWDYCDDSRITHGDERQLHTNSPYVLWFQRRPN